MSWRELLLAFVIPVCASSSLRGAPILGYEFDLTAARSGIFSSRTLSVTAADVGSGRYHRLDTRDPEEVATGTFPAPIGFLLGSSGSPTDERGTATVAISPNPFTARVSAVARALEDGERARGNAGLSVGDLIRIEGPGSEVEVTFQMRWTMNSGGFVPAQISGEDLGIFGDPGVPIDIAVLAYEFAMFLQSTQPQPCPGNPLTYFSGSHPYSEVVTGDMYELNNEWNWAYRGSVIDEARYGDGILTIERNPRAPWFLNPNQDVLVTYRHTVLVPTGVDLNLVTRWREFASCASPSCFVQYKSLESAGVGISLPDGYSLFSELGNTYQLLSTPGGEDGGGAGPGGEIPEPHTAVLAGLGLCLLALIRRRGRA